MAAELSLQFPDPHHVIVSLAGTDSGPLPFVDPFMPKDHADIRWYIETYAARALGDPDDLQASRIRDRLPVLGKALFRAVFAEPAAAEVYARFQDRNPEPQPPTTGTRLIAVTALHPAILALPWELLHDPDAPDGTFLFHERLSIRRRVTGATGAGAAFPARPKDRLHLLFVVSRPQDAGFIDPRADPAAVLDALDARAQGRVTCEFLRPPTLAALTDRLTRTDLPPVDILHFDGHGVFDLAGGLPARWGAGRPAEQYPPGTGYLLFECGRGGWADFIPAQRLGAILRRHGIALVILSACQAAAIGSPEPGNADQAPPAENESNNSADQGSAERLMGSVAVGLLAAGCPAVLAMTHSVLVATTRALFGEVYRHLAEGRPLGESLDLARAWLVGHPEKYEVQRGRAGLAAVARLVPPRPLPGRGGASAVDQPPLPPCG